MTKALAEEIVLEAIMNGKQPWQVAHMFLEEAIMFIYDENDEDDVGRQYIEAAMYILREYN